MNPQQPFCKPLGTLVVVASETVPRGNDIDDEPQTSSTEDMSDQSQNSLRIAGNTSANMSQLSTYLVSGGNPSSMKAVSAAAHDGTVSGHFQHHENGTKTDGDANTEEERKKEHKKRSKNWTRPETLKLIKARTELDDRFRKSGRKVALWDEISYSLQRANFSRDGQQCKDKWEKLTAGYKEVRDGARYKEDHPFYEELHPLLSWKSYKRESDASGDGTDPKRVKFEFGSSHGMASCKQVGMSCAVNDGHMTRPTEIEEVQKEEPVSPGKQKRADSISFADLEVIQELLETIITRQQRFFKELLDAVDRKEQLREQIRHEREEKWRAEERAQRFAFNNEMIVLTQRLLGERPPGVGTSIVPAPILMPPNGGLVNSKKRSKNWKKTEVFNLIRFRREMESKFVKSTRRAGLWEELGVKLGSLGINRDGKQCREKWDKLMAEYKDVVDGRKDKEESPYFAELTTFLGRAKEVEAKSSPETTKEEYGDI